MSEYPKGMLLRMTCVQRGEGIGVDMDTGDGYLADEAAIVCAEITLASLISTICQAREIHEGSPPGSENRMRLGAEVLAGALRRLAGGYTEEGTLTTAPNPDPPDELRRRG